MCNLLKEILSNFPFFFSVLFSERVNSVFLFQHTYFCTHYLSRSSPALQGCIEAFSLQSSILRKCVSCTMKLWSAGIAPLSSNCCATEGTEMCWDFVYPRDWAPLVIWAVSATLCPEPIWWLDPKELLVSPSLLLPVSVPALAHLVLSFFSETLLCHLVLAL